MVAYSPYENDNRVRRYAESLARRGDQVDVVAISMGDTPLGSEEISGVTVHRIQRRQRNEGHMWSYGWRLLRFTVAASLFLRHRHAQIGYDLVHVHNIPDFLVFSAWYPKATGARVILDIHDIVPELFADKFASGKEDWFFGLLKQVEKAAMAFADHVIVSNHLWYEKLISRSVPASKCSVFVNNVDPAIFYRHPRSRNDEKLIVVYAGTLQWHQGLDIAIEAFATLKERVPNAELHIYGDGNMKPDLAGQAHRLGLNGSVSFPGTISLEKIPEVIANADLGVVPKRADSFGNEAYSTKIMEMMSQGVPVVASRTRIDSFYFDDTVIRFFPSGDSAALAEALLDIIENQPLRNALVAGGLDYVERNGWGSRKKDYLEMVDSLVTETFPAGAAGERS